MININELDEEELAILRKASKYQQMDKPMDEPEYRKLFHDFTEQTRGRYLDEYGFKGYEVAVLNVRRKKRFNPFKSSNGVETKVITDVEACKGYIGIDYREKMEKRYGFTK